MALIDQRSLNPGVAKRELFGWAMYDFAHLGYTMVVRTAVFSLIGLVLLLPVNVVRGTQAAEESAVSH